MKRSIMLPLLVLILCFLTACTSMQGSPDYQVPTTTQHTHKWDAATCEEPKTCRTCGEVTGYAKGHDWRSATCTDPKTCATCNETEGSAKGHSWNAATCTAPKTCSVCNETEGSAKGHSWSAATCRAPKTCNICGVTEGTAISHADNGSGYCKYCGGHILLMELRESVTAKLIVPSVGTQNYYLQVRFENDSDYTFLLTAHVYGNGKGCCNLEAANHPVNPGYTTTGSFYRSIIASERWDDKYKDMYLDNNSQAWTIIHVNGTKVYMKFDTRGNTIFGLTASDIGEY